MRDLSAVEKHYRVKELADLWGFSENTIIKLFSNEDGVLRLESPTANGSMPRYRFPRPLRSAFMSVLATKPSRRLPRAGIHFA
jgi:hypothetical protein